MSPLLFTVKHHVEKMPQELARPLAKIPFIFRLGLSYTRSARAICRVERDGLSSLENNQLALLRRLLTFAVDHIEFYRAFYRSKGFAPGDVQSLVDWTKVPVVTKADLQGVSLEQRTARGARGIKVNTGGTTGQPLEFYLDRQASAREWAHMHHIWKAHGYRPSHLKLTFRGKHFDTRHVLRYNALHNEYIVNANAPMSAVVQGVLDLPPKTVIRWLHGYPSLVAEFAHACTVLPPGVLADFRSRLFGVLLGSEYPASVYRSVIEHVLSSNVVSWYGHSEMAVLARETALGVYESLPTYGYAEAVSESQFGASRLVCSSLHNRVHPFIRNDTGDLIEPVSHHSGSLAFRIVDGRIGEYIVDRNGMRHSLTAIIFGRHHAAFSLIKHLQVRQDQIGRITFLVTPLDSRQNLVAIEAGLDLKDLDLDWRVELLAEPVRTNSGKIKLKVDSI